MFQLKIMKNKLSRDILWTMISFSILSLSGIAINVVVTTFRDTIALGVFNLAYAIYVIVSQLASMGIHNSVLRHAALHEDDDREREGMFFTAAILSLGVGLLIGSGMYLAAPLISRMFSSARMDICIQYIALALILFTLNKVLVAYLNSLRHMLAFSIVQANRYVMVMLWVTWISLSKYPFEYATLAFLFAEVVTTLFSSAYILKTALLRHPRFDMAWARRHFSFGFRSLLAGMFLDLNTRVDVLLLGVFLDERAVGVYSFAAMLFDGLYHLLAMVRINFNPVLVVTFRDKTLDKGQSLLSFAKRYVFTATAALSLLIMGAFVVYATYLVPASNLREGMVSLATLLAGLLLISAFVPFDNVLMVSGYPTCQTLLQLVIVIINIVLNVLLVPLIGIEGAAIGTATSYIVGMVVMIVLINKLFGWNILTNKIKLDPALSKSD